MVLGMRDRAALACLTKLTFYCRAGEECWQLAHIVSCAQVHRLAEKQLLKDGTSSIAAGKAYFICGV